MILKNTENEKSLQIKSPMLSTGSTLLNLAITDDPFGGFAKGKYFFLVGDSSSGKTFLSMTCFAEATLNKEFKNYRLIYDNIEDGMLLNLDSLFNEQVADRIEPPAKTKDGTPIFSDTIESFYFHLDDAVEAGKPFIYVLDSMDALDSEAAEKKFEEHKEAYQKRVNEGKEVKTTGSMGDGKAKKNSEFMRKVLKGLRNTGSILIVLSQTRDNIGGYGKTRSGGRSLRFYSTVEVWSSIDEQLEKTVKKKERKIGTRVKLEVRKNRITGKLREALIDIYPDSGIDDLGSCVDYLVSEGVWTKNKRIIQAPELGVEHERETLIEHIEKGNLEDKVRLLCGKTWKDIEEAVAVRRKNRYQVK